MFFIFFVLMQGTGTFSSFSSLERVVTLFPGVAFQPCFFEFVSFPLQLLNFFKLKHRFVEYFTVNCFFRHKRLSACCLSSGYIPLHENLKQGYVPLISSLACTTRRKKLFLVSYPISRTQDANSRICLYS